jgi:hypothetical protein
MPCGLTAEWNGAVTPVFKFLNDIGSFLNTQYSVIKEQFAKSIVHNSDIFLLKFDII